MRLDMALDSVDNTVGVQLPPITPVAFPELNFFRTGLFLLFFAITSRCPSMALLIILSRIGHEYQAAAFLKKSRHRVKVLVLASLMSASIAFLTAFSVPISSGSKNSS